MRIIWENGSGNGANSRHVAGAVGREEKDHPDHAEAEAQEGRKEGLLMSMIYCAPDGIHEFDGTTDKILTMSLKLTKAKAKKIMQRLMNDKVYFDELSERVRIGSFKKDS